MMLEATPMDIKEIIKKIFAPAVGVEVVFNLNSLQPLSQSTIIYDVDYTNRIITTAQPKRPISKKDLFDELHLTTLTNFRKEKTRWGIPCTILEFNNSYRLSNNTRTEAIILQYTPDVIKTNIRSAYRLPLSRYYTVKADLTFKNDIYSSGQDFFIRDISLAGIGLVIPKKTKGKRNPLAQPKTHQRCNMRIALNQTDKKQSMETISVEIQLIRINPGYSETGVLLGAKFLRINQTTENTLNHFIHQAQMAELKRISGL